MVDCAKELRHILQFLQAAPNISSVVLPLDQVLNLPLLDLPWDELVMRTPARIFMSIPLSISCTDVGVWTADDLPKIKVVHLPTRLALKKVWKIRAEGPRRLWDDRWIDFLLSCESHEKAVYRAFEYTAEFHDRRLKTRRRRGHSDAINLGISMCGYLEGTPWANRDEFSVQFASDLDDNIKYLEENPEVWLPRLYDAVRRAGSERDPKFVIKSKLRLMSTLLEEERVTVPGSHSN